MKSILILFLFSLISFHAVSQLSKLKSDLKYLSSDQLNGRKNGSPELLESAKWIAQEFKNIGLIAPDFTSNYLHEVVLLSVENISRNLVLNGLSISEDKFFILGQKENFHITDDKDIKLFIVGEQDDLMSVFQQINLYDKSYAVFIHPIHKKRFNRIKSYFSKSKSELENELPNFSLWVMSDEVSIQSIDLNVFNKLNKTIIYNVVGELPSDASNDRKWIYSAHYDHIGIIGNTNGDSIANGANDDASGVVAILELARRFSEGEAPEKSIYFVAFAGEELGLFGSKELSSSMNLDEIEAMINIEMIGLVNDDLGPQSAFISGYELSYLPKDIAKNISIDRFMFFPDPYSYLDLFNRSDNAPFAAYGIAAHSISTYSEDDKSYHAVNDEYENIDIDHLMEVIDAIYTTTLPLLKLTYDPGIIDYKTKNDR